MTVASKNPDMIGGDEANHAGGLQWRLPCHRGILRFSPCGTSQQAGSTRCCPLAMRAAWHQTARVSLSFMVEYCSNDLVTS